MPHATYDGLAEWYDAEQSRVAQRPDAPLKQFATLVGPGAGPVLELGCGTGLSAASLRAVGRDVGGIDVSFDQLHLARARCRWVMQADAHALPIATASFDTVAFAFLHTDVEDLSVVVREVARVLRPGGRVISLGIHPCFVGHHIESPRVSDDRLGVVDGYRDRVFVRSSVNFGPGIRSKVGARHVPLDDLLMAFITEPLRLERVVELGDGVLPWMLGVVARAD